MIQATGGGVVYPEGDAEALAQAILTLADDPARYAELARQGREGVTALYSVGTVAQKIIELVHSVMGEAA
jgi:glycosyltransferase involved in cell wall biosynthesis